MGFLWWLGVIVVLILTLTVIYLWYMTRRYGEIKKLGIDGPKPSCIVFKNVPRDGMIQEVQRLYDEYKHRKIFGSYLAKDPYIVVSDLDLVKEVLVKHFDSFPSRKHRMSAGKLLGTTMINLTGEQWKHVRSTLSPTFSSGKIKLMSKHVEDTARLLIENLQGKQERNEPIELKETLSCFTMDCIARAGYGAEIDSIKDPENPFMMSAKKLLTSFTWVLGVLFFFPFLEPLLSILAYFLVDNGCMSVYIKFVDAAMASRREDDSSRKHKDFVQLLVEADQADREHHDGRTNEDRETSKTSRSMRRGLTKLEIQGQAIVFMLASYDTLSAALSFTLFLLTLHPHTLEKVQNEIDSKLGKAFPNYDNIQSLVYMEMCLNEALRLFPPGFLIERASSCEVELAGRTIPADFSVIIPVYHIHHDPEYWPDPETFDPERFTPENKASRHPYAHLPFGQGPRNCIGMRLALLEMKIAVAAVLQSFTPVQCEKTVYPVKIQKYRFAAEAGLWVKLERRN